MNGSGGGGWCLLWISNEICSRTVLVSANIIQVHRLCQLWLCLAATFILWQLWLNEWGGSYLQLLNIEGAPIVLPSHGIINILSIVAPTLEYVVASMGSSGFGGIGMSGGSMGISKLILAAIAPCVIVGCVEDAFVGAILSLCMEVCHSIVDLKEFNIGCNRIVCCCTPTMM